MDGSVSYITLTGKFHWLCWFFASVSLQTIRLVTTQTTYIKQANSKTANGYSVTYSMEFTQAFFLIAMRHTVL